MAQLVYETTDTDFADRALEAMRDADIPCYRIGRGYSNQGVPFPGRGFSEDRICIYIERDADYGQANEILIQLGAVTDDPDRFPPKWVLMLLAIVAVLLAFWITSEWK